MTASILNGNTRVQRKSLNDQIERLDGILDGLAEALNESVADAVKQAVAGVVQQSVESAIKEVLSNPNLVRSLSTGQPVLAPPEAPPRRTLKDVLRGVLFTLSNVAGDTLTQTRSCLSQAWSWCLRSLQTRVEQLADATHLSLSLLGSLCRQIGTYHRPVGIALDVGALVTVAAYWGGPLIASSLCGLCSALLTAAGILAWPVVRLLFPK